MINSYSFKWEYNLTLNNIDQFMKQAQIYIDFGSKTQKLTPFEIKQMFSSWLTIVEITNLNLFHQEQTLNTKSQKLLSLLGPDPKINSDPKIPTSKSRPVGELIISRNKPLQDSHSMLNSYRDQNDLQEIITNLEKRLHDQREITEQKKDKISLLEQQLDMFKSHLLDLQQTASRQESIDASVIIASTNPKIQPKIKPQDDLVTIEKMPVKVLD